MKQNSGFRFFLFLLAGLFIISWIIAAIMGGFTGEDVYSGNIAVIPIQGFIGFSSPGAFSDVLSPDTTKGLIQKAALAPNIKAIVFDINSGGGTPVASETIVNAIKGVNKTTVAIIRDIGASGAYWVASAADAIIASKYSITGSVGVRGSFIGYYGLLQRYNMSYERLVSGELKDVGDPFKPMSEAERAILQKRIDEMHMLFLEDVQANRNLTSVQRAQISTGNIYLGQEAKALGLVDIVGGDAELEAYLKHTLNLTQLTAVRLEPKKSFWESLPSLFAKFPLQVSSGIRME
jgi:protease-4